MSADTFFTIIVEGKSDKEFLIHYLRFLAKKQQPQVNDDDLKDFEQGFVRIVVADGCDPNRVCKLFQYHFENAIKVFIIFDTDQFAEKRRTKLEEALQKAFKNEFKNIHIFLFPDNEKEGELETLLYDIAIHPEIIACFDRYVNCLDEIGREFHKNVHKKSKMFAYQEAVGIIKQKKKEREEKKGKEEIYAKFFNFESECLNPLKEFLQKGLCE